MSDLMFSNPPTDLSVQLTTFQNHIFRYYVGEYLKNGTE